MPGVGATDAAGGNVILYGDAVQAFEAHPGVKSEPPLAPYAAGSGWRRGGNSVRARWRSSGAQPEPQPLGDRRQRPAQHDRRREVVGDRSPDHSPELTAGA